jgi:peptidyl-prolyl cis-trans isomerase B (cyclophilin B)
MVTLNTTYGAITLELDAEKAPATVANFLEYAREGFYDGTIFHRVIDNFMIQGGGFDADMRQKSTRDAIENEADNGLTNDYGTVAMARTMDPHSATAQFFINVKDNDFLNHSGKTMQGWGYCVFGRVDEGRGSAGKDPQGTDDLALGPPGRARRSGDHRVRGRRRGRRAGGQNR